jgi:dimethylsulfide dehydrogenase subunit gamma/complex iron-sulfur molybdoenzyme family reductase subunit gamma
VQFALNPTEMTSHMMGSPEQPVNIWYWRSDQDRADNLGAGGFGSSTRLDAQPLSARSVYRTARLPEDNQWTLVMSRPLDVAADEDGYSVQFDASVPQPLAFAVWDGSAGQRDGLKRTTPGWITVDLAPLLKGS